MTDLSVKKLLTSFPEEWFSKLTQLKIDLENTGITNESLEGFITEENLSKFEVDDPVNIARTEESYVIVCIDSGNGTPAIRHPYAKAKYANFVLEVGPRL